MQGRAGRTQALTNNSDFFWEEMPTPILDMVENPINMKNLSPKVEKSWYLFLFYPYSVLLKYNFEN